MTRLAERVAEIRAEYLARTTAAWRGREREFVIELVRGLDEAAFAFTMAPNREQLKRQDIVRHHILRGAASALEPFLERLAGDKGGVPWGPTSSQLSSLADQYLASCGEMSAVLRAAMLERYGLAKATFYGSERVALEVASDAKDSEERVAGAWLSHSIRGRSTAEERQLAGRKNEIAHKIDRYVGIHNGWFIRYDNDDELLGYHRRLASIYAAGTAEGRALPREALLGGRPFCEWNESSISAFGRVLHHVAFATRLKATAPSLEMRNLLTIFARKDDVAEVLQEAGETPDGASRVMTGLTLDHGVAAACERDFEIPLPYYVDFGRDFVLLPMFGGLLNACAGLVWHLRRTYRKDWDRAVDGRERVFRDELRALFASDRYIVPARGFRLRRADGTELTDVDAVIADKTTGSLAMVQLKWPDIHGHSLAERNSRRLNLLGANEWVARVSDWIGGRSAREIAAVLGLPEAGDIPPAMLVLTRHAAQFAGEAGQDTRAHWISWPSFVQLISASPGTGIFDLLSKPRAGRDSSRPPQTAASIHRLPGLTVEIRTT